MCVQVWYVMTATYMLQCFYNFRYTFGERVQGTVKVNATLENSRRGESFLFYERTATLV